MKSKLNEHINLTRSLMNLKPINEVNYGEDSGTYITDTKTSVSLRHILDPNDNVDIETLKVSVSWSLSTYEKKTYFTIERPEVSGLRPFTINYKILEDDYRNDISKMINYPEDFNNIEYDIDFKNESGILFGTAFAPDEVEIDVTRDDSGKFNAFVKIIF